ncbi:MAG: radical SAM protein [Phycisphaeraceae bacterium]
MDCDPTMPIAGAPAEDRATVMIKPVGPACNLACHYCYYLPVQDQVYAGHVKRMSATTLESLFAGLLPRFGPDVTIAWQGGEPTMAGLPFFERAIALQQQYARPGQRIANALQTNATLLDKAWCGFLPKHDFLVGVSLDGPPRLHDHYRRDAHGKPSSDAVLRGMALLKRHQVEFNVLCVLNDVNVQHPDEVFGYLLNRGARWVQFIPAVEWRQHHGQTRPARFTPSGRAYGRFLCRVFDQWFDKHRHRISVRLFDAVLNKLVLNVMPVCILDGSCHHQLTVEHDGAVFGCDHFVEPRWQLARIGEPGWTNHLPANQAGGDVALTVEGRAPGTQASLREADTTVSTDDTTWLNRVDSPRLRTFADRKQHLPARCRSCPWLTLCYGGCPKHRPHRGDVAEPSMLCEGYRLFYAHALPRLQWLAAHLQRGVTPPPPARAARHLVHPRRDPRSDPCLRPGSAGPG